ncbi:putative c2h2 finger domain [Erysiphe necator]|uniref:RING-type E3 ubiquitin transferase n=1 Tax=Uncinula necator TaxID=52586 RepID=A0A0B1PI56_UNCNE|nr:putative c2h2 finger domain [Erysiphe necator]
MCLLFLYNSQTHTYKSHKTTLIMTDGSTSNTRHKVKSNGRGRKELQSARDNTRCKNDAQNLPKKKYGAQKDVEKPEVTPGKLPSKTNIEPTKSDNESCIICASDIVHESFGPCNHRTCHVCSVRLRVLFKDKTCTLCRVSRKDKWSFRTKRFEDFTEEYFKKMDFPSIEENIGLRFDTSQIRDDTLWMLAYNCPEKNCDVACISWPHLHDHTRKVHGKKICDLCSKHRKIFPHEHDLFTDAELSKHMKKGDKSPASGNQTGFKGHPLCIFCGNRFYGDDELFKHLREKHERCFVCDLANPDMPPSYYVNYEALHLHFVQDHFICKMKDCVDQKYIAFVSEFELRAHMIEVHGSSLSKDDLRDLRNIDLSDFSYRQPYMQERRDAVGQRGNISNRGRGRVRGIGRDPNVDLPQPLSSQPLRRDEQAFQRQLAVQSSQSVTTRNSVHQNTTPASQISNNTPKSQSQVTRSPQTSNNLESANIGASNSSELIRASNNPRFRSLKDQALSERASLLLQKDPSKISQFQSFFIAYNDSTIKASTLIDNLISLLADSPSNSIGTLIREIADLTEDRKKAEELRKAWNDWRAINEDYPSLPTSNNGGGSSGILSWAARTGNFSSSGHNAPASSVRIINLKKSTTNSDRSFISQPKSWGSQSIVSSSVGEGSSSKKANSSSAFPSLPPSGSRDINISRKSGTKIWGSTVNPTSNSSSNIQDNIGSSSTASLILPNGRNNEAKKGKEAFPSLPTIEKPQGQIFGNLNRVVKKNTAAIKDNAWRGNGETSYNTKDLQANVDLTNEDSGSKGKKKGNKEKKQLLMGWG